MYMEKDLGTFLDRFLSQKNGKHFIMVRHGESRANVDKLLYGSTNSILTDLGIEQAEGISEEVLKRKDQFTTIQASNKKRAIATGGLALKLGLNPKEEDIRRDHRFNELDFGPFERLKMSKLTREECNFLFSL